MPHCLILALLLFQNPSLDSASPKERQAAVEQLAVLGNRDAIPKLGEALKKESKSDIRASIIAAFGRIRDRDAIPFLTATLEDPQNREHRDVRIEIIRTLALIRDPAAGPALEKALRDPNKQIVLEAI